MFKILVLSAVSLFSHAQSLSFSQAQLIARDPQSSLHCTAVGVSKNDWTMKTEDGGALAPNISFGGFDLDPKHQPALICTSEHGTVLAEIQVYPALRVTKRATYFRLKLEPQIGGGFEFHMVRSGKTKYCQIVCR